MVRIEGLDVRAVPFEPEGGVRQHDIDDNKYLATTLAKIRQDQIARDEEKLIRLKTHPFHGAVTVVGTEDNRRLPSISEESAVDRMRKI